MAFPTAVLEIYRRDTVAGVPNSITSTLVSRRMRESARLAVNFPELHRTVELTVSPNGTFSVQVGPAPGHGGGFVTVYSGNVREEV